MKTKTTKNSKNVTKSTRAIRRSRTTKAPAITPPISYNLAKNGRPVTVGCIINDQDNLGRVEYVREGAVVFRPFEGDPKQPLFVAFANEVDVVNDPGEIPAAPIVPVAKGTPLHENYHPELADWMQAGLFPAPQGTPNGYAIYEDLDGQIARGEWVATIVVNPALSKEDGEKIAWFMSTAPYVWRAARELATTSITDHESLPAFNELVNAMFEATGQYPFAFPTINEPEENMIREKMRKQSEARKAV